MEHNGHDTLGARDVAEVTLARERLREGARVTLGVTGTEDTAGFRAALREHGLSLYPLGALGVLNIVDEFQGYAFTVLTPEISHALGISVTAIATLVSIKIFAFTLGPLPIAALAQRAGRRAVLCVLTAGGWSLMTLTTGLATSLLGLAAILIADGLSTGSVRVLHEPLLMDSYHPSIRVRILTAYNGFNKVGQVASPLLVGLLAGVIGLTWRGVFIALGLVSTLMTLLAIGLRDPGFGRWDTERLREAVHERHGDAPGMVSAEQVTLGFWEVLRRLLLIPTLSRLLRGTMMFGVLLIPLSTFLSFFLDQQFNLGPGQRGAFFAAEGTIAIVALAVYGRRGERLFQTRPARLLVTSGVCVAISVTAIGLAALAPNVWVAMLLFAIHSCFLSVILPALSMAVMSIIPSRMRPHAAGLSGIAIALGGLFGVFFLSGINERFGLAGTMVSVVVPGLLAGWAFASGGKTIDEDLDRMIDETLEEEEINRLTSGGGRLPMLACKGIDFSYGQLQVLFGCDFVVDQGEMVALLGVNGAGKSTLLKVISGIGLPTRGSVRFDGHDITYLDAERRVALGITQVPGGRAVFGPMTVLDNLRSYGHTIPGGRAARLDSLIDECFEAFPRLAERATSKAAQLSGGEQQMLALSKALILRPRLLIIDELSLGLAPVIVGQLLDMVRRINDRGTAVVLVEQSVNIALNLVEHAYFMEKGEIRFDGRAADLLARDDLLRAVFLAGAAARGADG